MEYIKKEELIEGEIYKVYNGSLTYIMKATKDLENVKNIPEYCEFMKQGCFNGSYLTFTNATPEEKHWLNEAIRLDKFITFEEAMKTFIPEYVEAISNKHSSSEIIGTIYKTSELPKWVKGHELEEYWKAYMFHYKPSTKEAYDAQFVVIEPLPQFKVIESIETITKVENNEGNQFFIGDIVISDSGFVQTIKSFRYNVNKDNVLATTNICNQISIARLEHYIESKVEETLLEKAKRLYPIGTKFINPNDNEECVIKEKGNYFKGNNNNIYHSIDNTVFKYEEGLSGCIYINNTWSKIIE